MSGLGKDDDTPPPVGTFVLKTFRDTSSQNSVREPKNSDPAVIPVEGSKQQDTNVVSSVEKTGKRHRRSVSHVGVSSDGSLPRDAEGVSLPGNESTTPKGHSRSQSHGQQVSVKGHKREGSRAEFILPEGHEQRERERELRPAKSFKKSSLSRRGHTRDASRTESIYTIRDQKKSLLEKLCFWKNKKNESFTRLVVPNPIVAKDVKRSKHPNSTYPSNHIRTTKYSLLSFIPKNLFEQFHRFANLYFLFIVLLNFVPMVNVFMKELAVAPLLFVLSVTAIKDACEDWRRYINDRRVNASVCKVFSSETGQYECKTWKDIRVGDIIQLMSDEIIPADMVVLNSSDEHGICYIESSNLDGETNLKQRQSVQEIANSGVFDPSKFEFILEVGPPTTKMYHFVGSVPLKSGERVALTKDNLILRDCVIKNTDYIEGIVVYAGCETKALLNHGGTRYKRSKLERQINKEVIWCVVILFIICVFCATGAGLWQSGYVNAGETNSLIYFLPPISLTEVATTGTNPGWVAFTSFWTFIILFQVLIPISLYVAIEVIKLMQIYHIHKDEDFKNKENGTNIECRALNIPEELGQVQHIFTDKTGTLTENKMVFQRCCFNGKNFTHEPVVDSRDSQETFIVNSDLEKEISTLSDSRTRFCTEAQTMSDFFFTLAACNTVIVAKQPFQLPVKPSDLGDSTMSPVCENSSLSASNTPVVNDVTPLPWLAFGRRRKMDLSLSSVEEVSSVSSGSSKMTNGRTPDDIPKPIFEAESPDELALVNAAYSYGFRLLRRNIKSMSLYLTGRGTQEYEVLHVLPFDSNRKRMSIVIKDPETGHKVLYCKGADSSILENLCPVPEGSSDHQYVQQTEELLNVYSKKGLRVLCMAKRVLTTEEYHQWSIDHKKAENCLANREEKLSHSFSSIEKNMKLLGATGIEDCLQDGVPETIRALRNAGIVIWVLTGDKQETAINIAYACGLFTAQTEMMVVSARTRDQAERIMGEYLRNILFVETCYRVTYERNLLKKRGLVIDGRTLVFVLDRRAKLSDLFLTLTAHCSSVMCCRATPLQKALVIRLIKGKGEVLTLAVGDGANDVSMIKTADVGVGISGVEGRQAVMSSDYAITRFRHLEKLILVHGHWCYDRLSRVILFFFYKNACFVFLLLWFQFYCGYSGSTMIGELTLTMFNLIYTSLPPLTIGIYDKDCPEEILLSQPSLYAKTRLGKVYTSTAFRFTILDAMYQSFVIFFVSVMVMRKSDAGMYELGFAVSHTCLVTQLLHVSIETKSWTVIHIIGILLSYFGFFCIGVLYTVLCVSCEPQPSQYGELANMISNPTYWCSLFVTCVLALLPRVLYRTLQATLWPDEVTAALIRRRNLNKGLFLGANSMTSSSSSLSSVRESTNL